MVLATWPGQEIAVCYSLFCGSSRVDQVVYAFADLPMLEGSQYDAMAEVSANLGCDTELLLSGCYSSANFQLQLGTFLQNPNATVLVPSVKSSCPYEQALSKSVRLTLLDETIQGTVLFYTSGLDAMQGEAVIKLSLSALENKVLYWNRVQEIYRAAGLSNLCSSLVCPEFESFCRTD